MIQPAERGSALQAAAVIGLGEHAARARAVNERPIYPLVLGESDLPTPPHIVAAAQSALSAGYTFYPPGRGFPELRDAIATKLRRENNLNVEPAEQLFVTNGSGLGLYLAVLAMVTPGDEVIVSDPTYGPFLDAITLAGATPTFASLQRAAGEQWRWDPQAVRAAITPRTAALILNTPSAPHGSVLTEGELRELGALAVEYDFGLISDEVFEHLTYDGRRPLSVAALDPHFAQRTVSVFSCSKSYLMTGWRLGYNVGPPGLIAAMERCSLALGRPTAAFIQQAGIAALTGPQEFIAEVNRDYTRRRAAVCVALQGVPGIDWLVPEGAFYVFLDFRRFNADSAVLAGQLVDEAGVVLTPGTFYGPGGQGWLRLSFAGVLEHTLAGIAALWHTLERWHARGAAPPWSTAS